MTAFMYIVTMTKLRLPPKDTNDTGDQRRIGVEIEFGGLNVDQAAALVQDVFGGEIVVNGAHLRAVKNTDIGDFGIELDAQTIHPSDDASEVERDVRRIMGDVSSAFVPTEIVGPPAPIQSLNEFDLLIKKLREAGAEGTSDGLSYAFGMQLNPEAPSLAAEDILRVLQAYVLLSPLLRRRIDVDPLRRALPYVDPYPAAYNQKILRADYAPDIGLLIDDYLEDNPTRNRDLDMLPLFAHLDSSRVHAKLDDPLIKSRPTYHYRLPNTDFDKPNWGVITEWNRWVMVERLADNKRRLRRLADDYLEKSSTDFLDRASRKMQEWFDEIFD